MSYKNTELVKKTLAKRYRKERNFRRMGGGAIIIAFTFLCLLLGDMLFKSIPAFTQNYVVMDITYDMNRLGLEEPTQDSEVLNGLNYRKLVTYSLYQEFPQVKKRKEKILLKKLISSGAPYQVKDRLLAEPSLLGQTVSMEILLDDDADTFVKSDQFHSGSVTNARLRQNQINWLKTFDNQGRIVSHFNWLFFTNSDSRDPELAGIKGAVIGTLLTILVTVAIAFPIGVFGALYLEEFAPKNRWTDFIEININNLASVPSIVFGLLGLAIFINIFGLPRSAPIVGGCVLALMTLPTIIISSRAAIKAVPPSLKEAALGLGASHSQMVFHQVLPQAMPGILTGTIIGIAQAIGETAPLLMIGMVAFIVDIPADIMDSATVLPVQIYIWSDSPERAFTAKTSAAILVLLGILVVINATAVYLRKKFEHKW